jgi:hypothetical protein
MRILTDKILQAFESHGNLHLILGVTSGQIASSGDELSDPVVTLVIPGGCARKFSSDLATAIVELLDACPAGTPVLDQPNSRDIEYLGAGVTLSTR